MKCPLCGAEFSETLTSCPSCGRVVEDSDREKFVPRPNNPAMTYNDPGIGSSVQKYNPAPAQQSGPAMGYNGMPQQTKAAMGNNRAPQSFQGGSYKPPIKKSTWIIIASAAAAILLIAIIAVVISNNKNSNRASTVTEENTESTTRARRNNQPDENLEEFAIGETWTVDGLLAVTVLGVEKTDYRNEFNDKNPEAVYNIKYAYTNYGYEYENFDGLYISLDRNVTDSAGEEGYSYPGDIAYHPQETPVGATCVCYSTVGVDNDGIFKVVVSQYDEDYNEHKACFVIEPGKSADSFPVSDKKWDDSPALKIGETWTVDDQWSLTITGVREVQERNEYTKLKPNVVYVIDYTYTNLGYTNDYGSELYISLSDIIVDSQGMMGYSYPGNNIEHPKETAIGKTCNAQDCIGTDNPGDFKITISKYDGNGKKQKQSFIIEVK